MQRRGPLRSTGVSHVAMAALLLASLAAQPARGQGFAGTPTVAFGSATITPSGANSQSISIPNSSPVTTINWAPTDTAVGGGPIDFLPASQSVSFTGQPAANQPYTVLNRIVPVDATRTIAFNGAVTSGADVRVWFYSPGGLLVGSTASFNVGGLVLTTSDPVPDVNGNFMGTFDRFSLAGAAGATGAVTIAPGAQIKVDNSGTSFPSIGAYMVAFGQKIDQGGTINVLGKTALVAAESADFAIDTTGLFSISVTSGTTVSSNTFVHSGSTGGSGFAANTDTLARRVYMVAVPKNNAITMAIASGGSIGFDIAGAAQQDGNAVVLSAGYNINDTGTTAGNPIATTAAGSGNVSLTIDKSVFNSRVYGASTDSLAVADSTGAVGFRADALLRAPNATVTSTGAGVTVDGNLSIDASATGTTAGTRAGSAALAASAGGQIAVGNNANGLGVVGDLDLLAEDHLGGQGGTVGATIDGGTLTVAGTMRLSAAGSWDGLGAFNPGGVTTDGGTATLSVLNGGGATITGPLRIDAGADATGAAAAYNPAIGLPQTGVQALAGSASLTVSGTGSQLAAGNVSVNANATGGVDDIAQLAGSATGGQANVLADSGGLIQTFGSSGQIATSARAQGGGGGSGTSDGGAATGGTASITANSATLATFAANGFTADASAFGGSGGASSGNGGSALGGSATIASQGPGLIRSNTVNSSAGVDGGTTVVADAVGGGAAGDGGGGNAVAGRATLATLGGTIALDHGNGLLISANAIGGGGLGLGGGSATGGQALIHVDGGGMTMSNVRLTMNVSASGGGDQGIGNPGDGIAGTIRITLDNGGNLGLSGLSAAAGGTGYFIASATGGSSASSGPGGKATSGNVLISNLPSGGTLGLDNNDTGITVDTSATGGSGGTTGAIDSAGGALVSNSSGLSVRDTVTLVGNTSLTVRSAGGIDVSGTGQIIGTGAGARLALQADLNGTGAPTTTVSLGTGALNLSGAGATIDIYYNAPTFGTPVDFSPGVTSGLLTGYELVNNLATLVQAGNFLGENFALSRDINAAATEGLNGGAGFVPIGSPGSAYTGNFDGLGHTIDRLFINRPGTDGAGLFGAVSGGQGTGIVIRNVGLTNARVTGGTNVGILVGEQLAAGCPCGPVTLTNVFTTGNVSAIGNAGGLLGGSGAFGVSLSPALFITDAHSDATLTALPQATSAFGGLIGAASAATIDRVHATGAINGGAAQNGLGGLIGNLGGNGSSLSRAYATGAVTAGSANGVGGLIGNNGGQVSIAYATGAVTATGGSNVGGLVGNNNGSINEAWSSGAVSGGAATDVGGLVGLNTGGITTGYWDSFSTGQQAAVGLDNGLNTIVQAVTSDPAQAAASNYALNPSAYVQLTLGGNWLFLQRTTGGSRPLGAWELPRAQYGVAPVGSAHQVELIDFNPLGSYSLQHDIAMDGTVNAADVWGGLGFMPIGYGGAPFSGTLAGNGRVLSGLTVTNNGPTLHGGLFDTNGGTITDLGLVGVNVNGEFASAGAIAGLNIGTIFDSFATGTVQGTGGSAGGLVGDNDGGISQSYADVAVTRGSTGTVGGLVGNNAGAGTIFQTYARGTVSGGNAGGLVGNNAGTVTGSYWDNQLSGQALGCGGTACAGATGLTTAQTMQAASFAAFANGIDTTGGQLLPWRIYPGQTTPLLKRFLSRVAIQAGSATLTYNAQVPTVAFTAFGSLPGHTSGTASFTGIDANAGSHAVFYGGGLFSDQTGHDFVASTTPGTILINPAPLALNAVTDNRTYNATTGSNLSVNIVGLQGNDLVTNLSQSFDSANVGSRTLSVNTGFVINDGNGGNNYTVTTNTAAGSISAAALTLSAVTDNRVYDATTGSNLSVSVTGLKGNDTVTGLAQSFDSANVGNRTLSVNAGFTVNDGNGGANYLVTRQTAAGSISAAPLTLSAVTDSRVYDATTTSAGTVGVGGLKGSDTVTGLVQSFDSANVGNRTLSVNSGFTVNDGNGGANYSVTRQSAAGSISAAPLVLSAVTDSRAYNATTGSNGVVGISGLKGNDTVTGLAQSFDSANAGRRTLAVNSGFTINDGNGGGNYAVTTQSAAGSITPASLAVTYTANPTTSVYGDPVPTLSGTVSATGLQGNDTLAAVTIGTAAFTTAATASSGVGNYAIAGSGLTANSANYQFSFLQAAGNAQAFIIVARPLTITADPQSREQGKDNPVLTFTVVGPASAQGGNLPGLVNGDKLTGGLATTATIGSPAGSYAITQGTLAAPANYQIRYVGNLLVVTNNTGPALQGGGIVLGNLPSQSAGGGNQDGTRDPNDPGLTEEEKRELAAVGSGLKPPTITQSLINDQPINQPAPVNTPVTSNGNPSAWSSTQPSGGSQ